MSLLLILILSVALTEATERIKHININGITIFKFFSIISSFIDINILLTILEVPEYLKSLKFYFIFIIYSILIKKIMIIIFDIKISYRKII